MKRNKVIVFFIILIFILIYILIVKGIVKEYKDQIRYYQQKLESKIIFPPDRFIITTYKRAGENNYQYVLSLDYSFDSMEEAKEMEYIIKKAIAE